jgi:hypothetical protein
MTTVVALDARRVTFAPSDTDAFFDADWVPADGTGRVPALLATSETLTTSWEGGGRVSTAGSAEEAVARALASTAAEAVAALHDVTGCIEVIGRGALAVLVRDGIRQPSPGTEKRPAAIVLCTAEQDTIVAATERLDDLGTLVLAGPPPGESVSIDLYPDVHVRGLRLVGVAPPLSDPALLADEIPEFLRASLGGVDGDGRLDDGALWYRVPAQQDPGTP